MARYQQRNASIFGIVWFVIKGAYKRVRNSIVRNKARSRTLILTDHAKQRIEERHITLDEIRQALRKGTLNDRKSETRLKPYPKYVIDSVVKNNHPSNHGNKWKEVEIVLSLHETETVIVTVIDKDTDWPVEEESHSQHAAVAHHNNHHDIRGYRGL